jgi:phage terminase large subunit GpA-like protein
MTPTQVDVTVKGKKIKHGAKLWPVNVSMAKSELYGQLQMDRPEEGEPYPAGWVHFPSDIDEEFFKQLTAEQLTAHVVKGYRRFEWVKMRERNEALDCANYARAAACACGIDRFGANRWLQLEANVRATSGAPPAPQPRPVAPPVVVAEQAPPPQALVAARQQERYVGRFNVSNWLSR